MNILLKMLVFISVLLTGAVRADVILLVHGYLGDSTSWEYTGISQMLDANGWKHGGRFVPGPAGPMLLPSQNQQAGNTSYVVDLPSLAPVLVQSDLLLNMLHQVRALHPGEAMTVVGHSAGGVVARLAITRDNGPGVNRLITIASPHLGTFRANQAMDYADDDGPMHMFKDFFGGDTYDLLRDSRAVLYDLEVPRPGNALFWLNAQPHPDIEYISVVRIEPDGFPGDYLVPGYSQDMNNVPMLRGRSQVIPVPSMHELSPGDGLLLLGLQANGTQQGS